MFGLEVCPPSSIRRHGDPPPAPGRPFDVRLRLCRPGHIIDPRSESPPLASLRVAPLADALAPLLDRMSAEAAVANPDAVDFAERARAFVDPAEVLAMSLGLGGSMELDSHLRDLEAPSGATALNDAETAPAVGPSFDPEEDPRDELRAIALKRFAQLEAAVMKRMRALPESRSRVRGAPAFHAALVERDALTGRGTRRAAKLMAAVAREQCESYLVVLANLIDRVRGESRGLRLELGPAIAALGPRAGALESLDALRARASARITGQWLSRIPNALSVDFEQQARAAIRALPEEAEPSDLEAWYAPGGFVTGLHGQTSIVFEAVIEHERQALFGLIDVALQIDSAPASPSEADAH
jgi:hypothetical protein